ncbi:MAG: hypothetical protein KatS3mg053_3886 [Candidatus Roseilinea sp.]|nr:MAG: hypothetical protein KatS3mg053_3886 [Candidatus Roseilinea sp.]
MCKPHAYPVGSAQAFTPGRVSKTHRQPVNTCVARSGFHAVYFASFAQKVTHFLRYTLLTNEL